MFDLADLFLFFFTPDALPDSTPEVFLRPSRKEGCYPHVNEVNQKENALTA